MQPCRAKKQNYFIKLSCPAVQSLVVRLPFSSVIVSRNAAKGIRVIKLISSIGINHGEFSGSKINFILIWSNQNAFLRTARRHVLMQFPVLLGNRLTEIQCMDKSVFTVL